MNSNITAKIKALSLNEDAYKTVFKFYASLTDNVISLEEIVAKANYLNSKGINITKSSQIKVLANSLDFIKSQVEQIEKMGFLDAFVENPLRINSKECIKRIEYLLSIKESVKDENGKYNKIIFNKKEFDRKYGVSYLEKRTDTQKIEAKTDNQIEVKEEVKQVESAVSTEEKEIVNDEQVVETNPYILALSKDQTIRLTDEMLARYEDISLHLKHVLESLNYGSEIDETKSDNLIKLLTSGINDEREIIYYSLTYNKRLTDEEKVRIYKAIDKELQLVNDEINILNFNMGSAK
ncbi:MAG: hypothetical protein ACI4XR_04820 [Bacilli bacterium]